MNYRKKITKKKNFKILNIRILGDNFTIKQRKRF